MWLLNSNLSVAHICWISLSAKIARETHTLAPSNVQNTAKIGEIHGTVNLGFKRSVHEGYTYGKVANVEAGMAFLEDRSRILHWKIFRGISVRPLGAKTGTGREAGDDSVTLFRPFWVKHKKGQHEKVFLVPFLCMHPPSSHTWALHCTHDELGQLQNVRGVPLSEIGGVLLRTPEVGGADQTAALTSRVDAFCLRWEKEVRSDMSRRLDAEARKLAQGEDVALESSAGKKSSVVPGKRSRGRPPRQPGKCRETLRPGKTPSCCGCSWRMSC